MKFRCKQKRTENKRKHRKKTSSEALFTDYIRLYIHFPLTTKCENVFATNLNTF